MRTATKESVSRAFAKSLKRILKEDNLIATSADAGFVIPKGQKRGQRNGYQVFVKVARYSDQLLKSKPLTGGLLGGL